MRGQAAIEFILLIFMLVLVVISYSENATTATAKDITDISVVYDIKNTSKSISNIVDELYLSGSGSQFTTKQYMPVDTTCNDEVCKSKQYTDESGIEIPIKYEKPELYAGDIQNCLNFEGWATIIIKNEEGVITCEVVPQ